MKGFRPHGCLLLTALTAGPVLAQDMAIEHWTQWRGPSRTGQAAAPSWPDELSRERLEPVWRVELGPSYSGPVMDSDRIYTTETEDEDQEVVRALDRDTGEVVWEARWDGAMTVPFFAARNGSWIRSTPALDEDSLYVAGMRDVLVSLDSATGDVRWRVDFTERFDTPLPPFGFVCSPLVDGDHLYVQAGNGCVKLDKRTGETVWHALAQGKDMMSAGAFSSPVIATIEGHRQLVVQTRVALCGVDLESGETLWEEPVKTFRGMNILTPMVWEGGVFTSAYGGRAHFFDITKGEDGWQVSERWTNRAQGNMTSPVVIDDHAYLYLRSKRFCCVDLKAGEVAWISSPIGDTYWSLVAQGDRMLALTDAGELHLIAADPEGYRPLGTVEIADAETWAHLAVDQGDLVVRELNALAVYRWR